MLDGYIIPRRAESQLFAALTRMPAVILIGARQTGKSELARKVAESRASQIYDLEDANDFAALREGAGAELRRHSDKLVVIDEVQRMPELFAQLRVIIDELGRDGRSAGKFLLLGSVTGRLQRQSEGLTGRATQIRLHPLDWLETRDYLARSGSGQKGLPTLWNRGGYPRSLLAATDSLSDEARRDYIEKALYADILSTNTKGQAQLVHYQNLLRLLADKQKDPVRQESLASDLGLTQRIVKPMLTNLEEMMLVRRLPAYAQKVSQRVAKTPKHYICDSGILHTMLGKNARELDSRQRGASWEGFVIQNLCAVLPRGWSPYFFKAHGSGHEIDLVLQRPGGGLWAIEIKVSLNSIPDRKFLKPLQHLAPERTFVVGHGEEKRRYIGEIEVLCLADMMNELLAAAGPPSRLPDAVQSMIEPSSSLAEILQALNANDIPLINLRRARFVERFCRQFSFILDESSSAADQACKLWAQSRNELLAWLAAESARCPEPPDAEAWLEALVKAFEHMLNSQPPYSLLHADFFGVCRYDLFVHALASLMSSRCFAVIHKLASRKYYRHGDMLTTNECFWIRPILDDSQLKNLEFQFGPPPSGTAKQYAAEEVALLNSPLPLSAAIEAELILLLCSILSGDHYVWIPRIVLSQPGTPNLPFFIQATEPSGAKALLACLGLSPDAAGMAAARQTIAPRLESELAGAQNSGDWKRIERCLNMHNWHDLK